MNMGDLPSERAMALPTIPRCTSGSSWRTVSDLASAFWTKPIKGPLLTERLSQEPDLILEQPIVYRWRR
jgi:hypothetical protein